MPCQQTSGAVLLTGVLVLCTACGDSPISPVDLEAAQIQDAIDRDFERMSDRELLIAVLTRLDAMEEHVEQMALELEARIDSLVTTGQVTGIAAQPPGGGGGPPEGRGGQMGELLAKSDSIMGLANWLAEDAADVGTGGSVDAEAVTLVSFKVPLGYSAQLEAGGCFNFSNVGNPPPTRPVPAASTRLAAATVADDQLQNTLIDLSSQLNLDAQSVSQALTGAVNLIQSPSLNSLRNLGQSLPLPPGFASIASDPIGNLKNEVPGLTSEALDLLCGGIDWGNALSDHVTQVCGLISRNELPDIGALATLSTVTERLASIDLDLTSVCQSVNTMLDASLSIPRRQATIFRGQSVAGFNLERTFTTFPAFSTDLFPNGLELSFCI
jgi:hypothetical protein